MNYHQGFESSSEAQTQQLKNSQQHDRSGQHIADCLFRNRVSEPWPNQHLKYILMEYYIFKNEESSPPATWNCLLPDCKGRFATFAQAITHLDVCEHLQTTTSQYICPCCRADVQVPTISHGNRTMLKIKRSLETILGRPSSAGSSPVMVSPISEAGSSHEGYQAMPMPDVADNIKSNVRAPSSSTQHNKFVDIKPINTQSLPAPPYGKWSNESCLSSTTMNSSFGSGIYSPFSAQGASSASSMSQPTWSPPCDAQQFDVLSYQSTSFELPEHAFSQDITHMQLDATNMEGTIPCLPMVGSTDYGDMAKELQDEVTSFLQEWNQQGALLTDLPMKITQELCAGPVTIAGSETAVDLFSPTLTDMSTADTLVPNATTLHTTIDQPGSPVCRECGWVPDMGANRSFMKLRQAVEKHFKRNHQSKDHQCKVCKQTFRNRPDNVKPHVKRKHPEMLAKLYPKAAAQGRSQSDKAIMKEPGKATIKKSRRCVRTQQG